MYERFTDRARKVMQLASQAAIELNHEYIGTEHILIGVSKEGRGVASTVLASFNLDYERIREEVNKVAKPGPAIINHGKLPQTPRGKKVIEYAMEESRSLNHNHLGTEHILLGLLREKEGVASQILNNLGVTIEGARTKVVALSGKETGADDGAEKLLKMLSTAAALKEVIALQTRTNELLEILVKQNEIQRA